NLPLKTSCALASPAHSEIASTAPRMLATSKFRFVFMLVSFCFFFRGPGPIVGQRRRVMAPTFAPAASYLNARRVNLQVIPGSFGNLLEMGGLRRYLSSESSSAFCVCYRDGKLRPPGEFV